MDIGYAEGLIDGHFNIAMECEFADRYIMRDGEQVFESFTWKSFRYLKLRFRSCSEPVVVHSVHAIVSTYPYEERGQLSSGDSTLNGVFNISRATIRLCSNEFLMDTPWREQAQWLGDVALVTLPTIHSCFGDTLLTRKFLMQSGQNQHPTGMISNVTNIVNKNWTDSIPDYSLWWIKALLDQYPYAGEEELLHRRYPQTLRILDAHLDYLNEDTLIEDMPYWVFMDWAGVEKRGVCSAYNAIFYYVLQCLHELAEFKGDAYTAGLTESIRSAMRASFHETLFDRKRGCYADARIEFWGDAKGMGDVLEPVTDGVRILTTIGDYFYRTRGPGMTAFENELGGRVVVTGYAPWIFLHSVSKRLQLQNGADRISRNTMPVRVDETVPLVSVACVSGDRRRGAVMLLNAGMDDISEVTVHIRVEARYARLLMIGESDRALEVQPEEFGVRLTLQSIPARGLRIILLGE